MFEGNWTCSDCSGAITQLPFEPKEGQNITCKECYMKNRPPRNFERKMVQGSWKCAGCGGEITQLPFEPKGDGDLFCLDCFKKNKNS